MRLWRVAVWCALLGAGPASANYLVLRAPVACAPSGTFSAANPAASGYAQVFADDFTSSSTIDLANSKSAGFKWYPSRFFDSGSTSSAEIVTGPSGLTLTPTSNTGNYNLATAALNAAGTGYVGQAWGGGAYVEARVKFAPGAVDTSTGWPSFWGLALEHGMHNVTTADQWPGQAAGVLSYVETDVFEAATGAALGTNYDWTVHHWYGDPASTCGYGYRAGQAGICDVVNSATRVAGILNGGAIDWSQWHTVGQLWVPASANGGTGYLQAFFDGAPAGSGVSNATLAKVTWSGSATATPSTLDGSAAVYSVLDSQHLFFILGAGTSTPLNVSYVRVWQIPGCAK